MSLVPQPNQLDLNRVAFSQSLDGVTAALSRLRAAVDVAHATLWSLPDDQLLDLVTALGPLTVQTIFSEHEGAVEFINAKLAILDPDTKLPRAKVGPGKPLVYDLETNTWSINWPPEQENPASP